MASQDKELKELLKELNEGTIQLPDFQRDWVWDDNRIKSLIISLANNYPIGAVMFLETGGEITFNYRPFTGVTICNNNPKNLVLDGQQRLTSILNAMCLQTAVQTKNEQNKPVKKFYYIKLKEIINEHIDWDIAIESINENKLITQNFGKDILLDLSSQVKEFQYSYIPINILFNESEYSTWRNNYLQYYQQNDAANFFTYLKYIQDFETKVRNNIYNYHLPVITLSKNTPKEAVCQVFENVNTGGVALNIFELVTAMFAANEFELRKDWAKRKDIFENHKLQVLFDITATDFLTTITLYTKYLGYKRDKSNAVLCKKKNVLELSLNNYKNYADIVMNAFIEAAKFLNGLCIYSNRDLPYSTQLIPLSATIAALGDSKFHYGDIKAKLEKWFWCGIFGELYGGANETRYSLDIVGLMDWIINNGPLPNTIERAYFDPTRLISLQNRNSAAYKGTIALLMKNAKDFISGSDINLTYFIDENIDIHHIFPKKYCFENSLGLIDDKWNSVINKTPLSAKSNRIIGGNAPSIYLSKIEKDMTDTKILNNNLESHFISVEDIRNNNFDIFFIKRAKCIIKLIENAMGKPISGLDSENVVQKYGEPLND